MQTPQPPPDRELRAPAVLLGYQQRWCADRAQVKLIEKSRRVGLTWGEASDSVVDAAAADGEDTWYIGYTRDMAEEFILDCAEWAKHLNQVATEIEQYEEVFVEGEETKSVQAFRIKFASGYRISALSSSPRNLRGKQGRVIIDEAAFHSDLAELLKAALALLMWGGRVHIISTHNGAENPFNELVLDVRAGKAPYSLHRVTLDDAVADGLYRRICLKKGQQWSKEGEQKWIAELRAIYRANAAEELDCIPSRGGGIWLPRALIEARMNKALPVVRWQAPDGMDLWSDELIEAEVSAWCEENLKPLLDGLEDFPSCIGEDFGRYSDLTVIAPVQILQGLKRRFPFLVELANAPFKAQRQIYFYIAAGLPRLGHQKLDAGGNGSYLAEEVRREYGEQLVEQVVFSEAWYRENTAPLKAAFEDDLIELSLDADVLNDLAAFRQVKGVPRLPDVRVKGTDGRKRHGDAGIAILLAYAASRLDPYQPFTYESARHLDGRGDGDEFDPEMTDGRDVRGTAGFGIHRGVW